MVALLTLVSCLIAAVTALALQRQLVRQVDERLEVVAATSLRGAPGRGPEAVGGGLCEEGSPVGQRRPGPAFGTLTACFRDGELVAGGVVDPRADGFVRPLGEGAATVLLPVVRGAGFESGDETADRGGRGGPGLPAQTVELPDGGSYRVVAMPGEHGATSVVGLSLGEVERALARILAVEVVLVAACVALAAVLGSLLVRRELQPLTRVAATARRVSELPLHVGEVALPERVPASDADPDSEVGRVAAALNRMLDHVGAALSARHASEQRVRQFVADASHELRTPLAGIRGYAELTRRRDPGAEPVPRDVAHALRRVEAEAVRMSGLVEDLLLLARLDAGRPLAREEVDLTMLLLDAVSDARVAGPDHRWRLDLPEDAVTACGDAARLHQVLANLLSNARTHTPPGTTVTTRLSRQDGQVVVEVADDGPGIDAAVLPHVFERFARADSSRSRAAGSTGLGLAIVQAVVSAHGGDVTLRSGSGGTTVRAHLPGPAQPPR
ncbi:sensor histidine kinase [Kineococcus xinjiangensis]